MKKVVISVLSGILIGRLTMKKIIFKKLDKVQLISDKHLTLFLMMNQWVKVKQDGKYLAEYFQKKGYKDIAVYGMSYVGETLIEELKETNVHVVYGIDKNVNHIYADVDILSPEDKLKNVDAVIVTAVTFFYEIEKELSKKLKCPILSLEDILYEI